MSKRSKICLLTATVLVAVGALIFFVTAAAVGFDLTKLSTQEFRTKTYEISEDFDKISVSVETADVTFERSSDGKTYVECFEEEKTYHVVSAEDGVLSVRMVDERKWYDHIGISARSAKITIRLPMTAYVSLAVATETGNVSIPEGYSFETVMVSGSTSNISCRAAVSDSVEISSTTGNITLGGVDTKSVKLTVTTGNITVDPGSVQTLNLISTTGDVTVNGVNCANLTASCSTGKIVLSDVIASEKINAENTTGGVYFDRIDAAELTIKTSTGDVKGSVLTEKIFVTSTSTGAVSVPESVSGGKCKITTSTGYIRVTIAQ